MKLKKWLGIMVAGVIIFVSSYLPLMNPPQCPNNYTQAQIDASGCVIGANIGAGLIWMFGIFVLLVGFLGIVATHLITLYKNKTAK
jgi:hypothetical protein